MAEALHRDRGPAEDAVPTGADAVPPALLHVVAGAALVGDALACDVILRRDKVQQSGPRERQKPGAKMHRRSSAPRGVDWVWTASARMH
jgi:hypothetical protein